MLEERDKLHGTWQERNEYLRQLLDQQIFYRDANQLETISVTQEVHAFADLFQVKNNMPVIFNQSSSRENLYPSIYYDGIVGLPW